MSVESIVKEIDAEIARLEQAKQLLSGFVTPKRGAGRPRANAASVQSSAKPKRRTMSAAGRARIAAAQKARWANAKKATSKSAMAKAEATK